MIIIITIIIIIIIKINIIIIGCITSIACQLGDLFFSFLQCLTAGLAYYISLKYAPDRTQMLKVLYEEEFKRAADTNRENVSSHFVPKIGLVGGSY